MICKKAYLALVLLVPLVLLSSLAQAATRTVCFRVQIRDERTDCPTPFTAGANRVCDPGADYSDFVGGIVEFWDKDTQADPSTDDFIGSAVITNSGSQCYTFEWENAPHGEAEANPDVYMKIQPQVRSTSGTGPIVRADDFNDNFYLATTGRDSGPSFIVNDCAAGTTCTISAVQVPTLNASSDLGQAFMMIDSAQRVLQVYSSVMENVFIYANYPASTFGTPTSCPTGQTQHRSRFCVPSMGGSDADIASHEMGHVLQMHLFHQDTLNNICNGSWDMGSTAASQEPYSCTTAEGWGAYVAATAWYNPSNASTIPIYHSVNIESAAPAGGGCNASLNAGLPRQAAKAFWDMDDANNEAGGTGCAVADASNEPTLNIALIWDDFADGTGDKQDLESGDDGVDLWDWYFYAASTQTQNTLIHHNGMSSQE